ncbi:type I polyketide synthase [Streptomyces sp. NPDC087844]|uniref:type I polyketide synthase n=1 Tax=Streptomyces sp. NPDC087844 TaxID=3365805 RepID=UPI00380780C5
MAGTSIAVVGLACRLPHADDPSAFWRLLRDGRNAITPMPENRRTPPAAPVTGRPDLDYDWRGGFLRHVDLFDAGFFGISPREALAMDPQQRLMLELAWEALEDAGLRRQQLAGSGTGVFAGAIWDDYATILRAHGPTALNRHSMTGLNRGIIANRVSHAFGLRGPSLTVDAAQSSSLTAVHLACEALRHGDCDQALAGGVNLILGEDSMEVVRGFGGLSPDGRCYTFDARANGFVRGEGGVALLLKPLHAAQRDGDPVYCVIEASAVNNDGATDGLTVPSAEAQEAVVRLAHRRAGISPAEVQYVELHGTGTPVGDPVEAAALGAALGAARRDDDPLLVGSAKTNIGHLEGASGAVGLLKTVLSMAHGLIPPSLNHTSPHPRIPLTELGLRVQRELIAWPHEERRKVAGVSSFGMGGTNCHVVLAEAPPGSDAPSVRRVPPPVAREGDTTAPPLICWPLSGHGRPALLAQAARLRAHAQDEPSLDPADIAYSLATTRTALGHRAVVLGADRSQVMERLAAWERGASTAGVVEGEATGANVALLFSGQGSQRPGMGRELYALQPVFASALDEAFAHLDPHLDRPLREVVFTDDPASPLHRTGYAQPALFAIEVALYRLAEEWGLQASHLMGHSVGEIAAAHVAGALSLPDACALVAARGRLMQSVTTPGAMAALQATEEEAAELLAGREALLTLAAVNGPFSVVISGDRDAVHEAVGTWRSHGRRTSLLRTSHAFHSPHMDGVLDELRAVAAGLDFTEPQIPLVSNVTGTFADAVTLACPDYWAEHARKPVRFMAGVHRLCDAGADTFIELGPDALLAAMARECFAARTDGSAADGDASAVRADTAVARPTALAALRRERPENETFVSAMAQAYVRGAEMAWERALGGPRQRVGLPPYAFQRERYWPGDWPGTEQSGQPRPTLVAQPEERPEGTGTKPEEPPYARRMAGLGAEEQLRALLDTVRTVTASVLGHTSAEAVAPGLTFKKLGMDSLGAAELSERLGAATGLPLPATLTFDHPTPLAVVERMRALILGTPRTAAQTPGAGHPADEPLAVVAMSCRYPGAAASPEELWKLVMDRVDAVGPFPEGRGWEPSGPVGQDPHGPARSYAREGGFITGADTFDAGFFGISPREALAMDPQQRLLLETAWEAFERTGISGTALEHSPTGVFVGLTAQDYGPRLHEPVQNLDGHLLTGTAPSVAAGRIAYTFGLEGPAVTVDTACSSSLVALHLAGQALRRGECDLALAGGATVMATPGMFSEFARQGGLAADGRCKPFSAAADGTGWSEGVGLVLLERLSDARRNGHRVLAVVRGSAINQDGASNGLTAPHGPSQERVVRQALASARLTPAQVDVVEAHGTGTTLGDPIEAGALLATYGQDRPEGRPLWLGSVKSNIGHTQAAAGVAGVIKMVMAMRHGVLPASLHIDEPSPHVDWESGAVSLLTEPVEWPESDERPRRAAVSSFGISGTNAHLILEEAPGDPGPFGPPKPSEGVRTAGVVPWVVSGRSDAALRGQAKALATYAGEAGMSPARIGSSLVTTRSVFERRAVVIGEGRAELVAGLEALAAGEPHPGVVQGTAVGAGAAGPVLVFPGQGSQWVGMGAELLDSSPVFAGRIGECERALSAYVDWSLSGVLRGDGAELVRVDVVQPVLWAVMVSLAAVWAGHGVVPSAVVGHSQGEIAAACVAGVLSLEDGAKVVALRSKALRRLSGGGAMASVGAGEEETTRLLRPHTPHVVVAAVNGPSSTVVSGPPEAVTAVVAQAKSRGLRARLIDVDYASHGPQIDEISEELRTVLAGIQPRSAAVAFYSTVTGGRIDGRDLDAGYWVRNLRRPVRFADTVRALLQDGHRIFIEASPHPVLTLGMEETFEAAAVEAATVPTLRHDQGGPAQLARALAQAFTAGATLDWTRWYPADPAPHPTDLPTYAFQRQRYWLNPGIGTGELTAAGLGRTGHPLLPGSVRLADGGLVLTGRIRAGTRGWLAEHTVADTASVPGAALLEWALRAADEAGCDELRELVLREPLTLPATGGLLIRVTVGPPDREGTRELRVDSREAHDADGVDDTDREWICHGEGLAVPRPVGPAPGDALGGAWPPAGARPVELDGFYERAAEAGHVYGTSYQGLRAMWRHGDDVLADVVLPEGTGEGEDGFGIHPVLLDAALHPVLLSAEGGADDGLWMPFAWSEVSLWARDSKAVRVRLTVQDTGDGQRELKVVLGDSAGDPVLTVGSLALRPADPARLRAAARRGEDRLFTLAWRPLPLLDGTDLDGTVSVIGEGSVQARWAPLGQEGEMVRDAMDTGASVVVADVHAGSGSGLVEVERASALVRAWLAEPRTAGARLVLVTRGAVPFGAPGGALGLRAAESGIWGRLRLVQTANPGRFQLLDLEPESEDNARAGDGTAGRDATAHPVTGLLADAVRAAVEGDERQVVVRSGRVLAPRWVPDVREAPTAHHEGGGEGEGTGGTVLISGGTGTWGAAVAEHLARTGRAARLLLVSRRGPAAPGAAELTARIEGHGAHVRIVAADLADPDQAAEVIAGLGSEEYPLTAVVHAAGVREGTPAQIWRARATVAARLEAAVEGLPLRSFVMFSEPVARTEEPGALDHAAAHAYCDALAAHRHARGLPGTSVTWGPWSGTGGDTTDPLVSGLLDAALRPTGPHLLATGADSRTVPAPPHSDVVRADARERRRRTAAGGTGRPADWPARLAGLPPENRHRAVLELVRGHAAAVLGHSDPAAVPAGAAFKALGFSSLTSVELRDRLAAATGLRLPAAYVFRHPTSDSIAGDLLHRLAPGDEPTAGRSTGNTLLNELARLEAAVAAEDVADADFGAITARLEDLLAKWKETRAAADGAEPGAEAVDRLRSASSAEQVLDFIDNELGVS